MDFLKLSQQTNSTVNITAYVEFYNLNIVTSQNKLPFYKGMVSLTAITSGFILIFASYIFLRALKIQNKSFVLSFTALILVGTISGTFSYGYLYEYFNKWSQFEPIDIGKVEKSDALCKIDPKKYATDC